MNMFFGKAATLAAAGLAVSAMLPAAASASTTITLTGNTASSGTSGNSITFSGGGVSVIATAYSLNGTTLKKAYLGSYDQGLGVTDCATSSTYCNSSSDSHTIDNSGWDDFVLFQFSSNVIVTGLTFGYTNDVDFSYKAASTSTVFPTVYTIADYAAFSSKFLPVTTVSNNSTTPSFAGTSGNLFLIGASFAAGQSDDSFKLKKITFDVAPVPEPATWAMMIGGLAIVGMSMRRRKTAVSFA